MRFVSAKCPNCGADLQVAENLKSGFCNHCGSKILFEPEVSDVKIDNSKSLENYRELALSAIRGEDGDNMLKYAEKALEIDAHDGDMWYAKTKALAECRRVNDINPEAIIECGNNAILYAKERIDKNGKEEDSTDEETMKNLVYTSYIIGALRLFCSVNKKTTKRPIDDDSAREVSIHVSFDDSVSESREENAIALAKEVPKTGLSKNALDVKKQFAIAWMEYSFNFYSLSNERLNGFMMKSFFEISPFPFEESERKWSKRYEEKEESDKQFDKWVKEQNAKKSCGSGGCCLVLCFAIVIYFLSLLVFPK